MALRAWLSTQGYKTNVDGGGDVAINPTENAQTLKLFQDGKLDGAWLPEPWASRLVLQAGAKVLVDEKDLWDGSLSGKAGEFPTTILIVNKKFAAEHPDTVKALLRGHAESVDWLNDAPAAEKATSSTPPCRNGRRGASADVLDRVPARTSSSPLIRWPEPTPSCSRTAWTPAPPSRPTSTASSTSAP